MDFNRIILKFDFSFVLSCSKITSILSFKYKYIALIFNTVLALFYSDSVISGVISQLFYLGVGLLNGSV